MCCDVGVILVYLLPYSPDLDPIKEFFAELKALIKKQWHEHKDSLHPDFRIFLKWCVGIVGGRERSAKGHFRHVGVKCGRVLKDAIFIVSKELESHFLPSLA
jgi:hypothetical protein